jgi:hypothetical protein
MMRHEGATGLDARWISLLLMLAGVPIAIFLTAMLLNGGPSNSMSAGVTSNDSSSMDRVEATATRVWPIGFAERHKNATMVTVAPGTAAIKPRPERVNLGPDVATFTEEDVVRYAETYGDVGLVADIDPVNAPTISKIEFITARELGIRDPGSSINQPDDALLCYVELAGSFALPGSPHGGAQGDCKRAYVVFHAHTGNMLMWAIDCKP